MSDETPVSVTIGFNTIVIKGWETTLREWYAANPPTKPLIYHYCEHMTACSAPMENDLFDQIYHKMTGPGTKVKAVKLQMTFGDAYCRGGEKFVKELGRMEAWRNCNQITLWVREVQVFDGLIKLVAYEDIDTFGGHIRMEFTRWQDGTKVRSYLRGLPQKFGFTKEHQARERYRR